MQGETQPRTHHYLKTDIWLQVTQDHGYDKPKKTKRKIKIKSMRETKRTVKKHNGNVSAAVRSLGISQQRVQYMTRLPRW